MELKDYYFILGVPRTATARDILRAFRELAKLYHPDVAGPQGTAAFQDIVEAYEILSDPERRRHYNYSLSEHVDVRPSAPPVGSARPQPEPLIPEPRSYRLYLEPEPVVPEPLSILHDFTTIRPSFEALYDRLRRNFAGYSVPKAERIERLTAEVKLTPYEALRGSMVPVGIPVFVRCTACDGLGQDWLSLCLTCEGQGTIETERTISVRIPPGVRDGATVEVSLHSLGIHNLYLRLHIRITW